MPMETRRLEFQPPALGDDEAAAAAETVRSGWLGSGPRSALLEERCAEVLGARHVVAVSSCTAALHLALRAAGVGPGDEVLTSALTWPATANAVEHCGARPVFCDVRESDLTIDPDHVARAVGKRTRAIVPVHLAGQPADLERLHALGVPVVEDAAHAFGSAYRGRPIGSMSEAACFSLYVTKPVAAGEGGLVATGDGELAARVRGMRGLRRDQDGLYDQVLPSFKASLPDVLAAVGLVQLDRHDAHTAARTAHAELYDAGIARLVGIEPLARDPRDRHCHHLYIVRIRSDRAGGTRDDYRRALLEEGIVTSVHFLPVHRLTWFRERYPDQKRLPVAEAAGSEVLSLPLSAAHTTSDIAWVVDALHRVHARLTA